MGSKRKYEKTAKRIRDRCHKTTVRDVLLWAQSDSDIPHKYAKPKTGDKIITRVLKVKNPT